MSEATDIQQKMFDLVRQHDLDGLRQLYHDDYVYLDAEGEQPGAEAGIAVADKYKTAFPDLTFETRSTLACGDDVAVRELTVRGTHENELDGIAPTGRKIEVLLCNIVEIRDGKIYREREYYDNYSILRQLGAISNT
ncbi:ester cyclase [Parasphingorhabdus pacifica]